MSRVEVVYQLENEPKSRPVNWQGNFYFRGIGHYRIESSNDQNTVSLSERSGWADPDKTRSVADLLPGQSVRLVRPTATLIVKNVESIT